MKSRDIGAFALDAGNYSDRTINNLSEDFNRVKISSKANSGRPGNGNPFGYQLVRQARPLALLALLSGALAA
jgi:hypothetical protein